jgi:hypothetical protein
MNNLYTCQYRISDFLFVLLLSTVWQITASAQPDYTRSDIYQKFNAVATIPDIIPFEHDITFNQRGGHLQGIQMFRENEQSCIYLSASSSNIAYLIKISLYPHARTIAADTLMQEPFRHAGGFQIYQHYLAIGIEDNHKRDIAEIHVYDLSKSDNHKDPVYRIIRKGEYEKVTAGATGMCRYKNEMIMAVANWDARNIDFYSMPITDFEEETGTFQKVYSFEAQTANRNEWTNEEWLSYQNINLFTDGEDRLFMMGFTRENTGQNVADLFLIHTDSPEGIPFQLKKIHSKMFSCQTGADFKAGAGAHILKNGQLIILACPYHISESSALNLFSD